MRRRELEAMSREELIDTVNHLELMLRRREELYDKEAADAVAAFKKELAARDSEIERLKAEVRSLESRLRFRDYT